MKFKLLTPIAIILVFFSVCTAQEETDDEILKIETRLVSVPVVVSNREGKFVSGLRSTDFEIFQDGEKQEISFFGDEGEPINVALLLDTSYSTSEVFEKIKAAAFDFVRLLKPADRAMIVSFDTDVKVLGPLSSNRNDLFSSINRARAENVSGTVLRKSVYDVLNPLFAEVTGRKAVILLTDGKDFGSRVSEKELLFELEESDVIVYSIFYSTELYKFAQYDPLTINSRMEKGIPGAGVVRSPENQRRIEQIKKYNQEAMVFLDQMSEITAGKAYQRDLTNLRTAFEIIVDELRNQYRLGFYPPDEEVGKVHQLKVKVNLKSVSVRSRKTYRSK
ncbi:MAG: VWA domain-containing protein [Pyrinomonadaceae bacterium]|nr:VWA domain-containing protein [Pyrinomonadaceae bacterium]